MHLLCPASAALLRRGSGHGHGGWCNSADTAGAAHGGVGSGVNNDIVPGFGGGSSDVPGLGNGGVGSEAEQEAGAGS
jgi:hypothetical protein